MYLTIFGKPRYLGLITADDNVVLEKGERVLIESSRGIEISVIAGKITERQEALYRSIDNRQEGQSTTDTSLQNVVFLGRVGPAELERERENRNDEDTALVTARQVLSHHDLDMKLVDVEYMLDRKKLFLYFTSEQRVDFRAYVRDLAREFRTRIELRQIGVRDESKVVKGIGACGRVCCCSYWLQKFMPIGIKMVKEQNLALNPTKISGLCGRLMCCMSFEQDNYRDLWKKLPSHGAKIKTEQGTWVLTGVDLASRSCTIHGPNGLMTVPVDLYQKFKETILAGETWDAERYKNSALSEEDQQGGCCQNLSHCRQCGHCETQNASFDAPQTPDSLAPKQQNRGREIPVKRTGEQPQLQRPSRANNVHKNFNKNPRRDESLPNPQTSEQPARTNDKDKRKHSRFSKRRPPFQNGQKNSSAADSASVAQKSSSDASED